MFLMSCGCLLERGDDTAITEADTIDAVAQRLELA
jgi:hypothetical protein